jgi:hypothetical protein
VIDLCALCLCCSKFCSDFWMAFFLDREESVVLVE